MDWNHDAPLLFICPFCSRSINFAYFLFSFFYHVEQSLYVLMPLLTSLFSKLGVKQEGLMFCLFTVLLRKSRVKVVALPERTIVLA